MLAGTGAAIIGSPPHTWRIPSVPACCRPSLGITSTYVENTMSSVSQSSTIGDHLHIRGEYLYFKRRLIMNEGSPPHTWRIRIFLCSFIFAVRITSTYVENTNIFSLFNTLYWDHLHIRGEYKQKGNW